MASMSLVTHKAPTKEGLLNFRYYYFVRRWGKQVVLEIFKYNFLHGTTKTILEIIKDAGVNLGKKSRFNDLEIRILSSNIPPENLDITFLYKICQILWEKNFNDPGSTLKDLLKNIKNERNFVSHQEGSVSEKELLSKLNAFGNTLETALQEAYIIYSSFGANFDQLKKEIQDAIQQIQEKIHENFDPSNPDDVNRFQSELDEFKDHLYEYIREKVRGELKDVYQDLCKILPFDWLCHYGAIDPSQIMIPLSMELDKEFCRRPANMSSIILDQKDILNFTGPSKKDPSVVILTGDVGSGKTTMLSSIVEKWYKESSDIVNLSSFQILLYMEFRSHDNDNFEDYLRDRLKQTVCDFGINLVKASILHSKCLLLCDGYDEVNTKSKKLFQNFLRLNCKMKKVIVTTRPVNSKDLSWKINSEKLLRINLNMLGVTQENRESHIRNIMNLLKTDETKKKKLVMDIVAFLKMLDYDVINILKKPLWLNMFLLLYIECPQKITEITTVPTLYMHLRELSSKRLTEKLGIDNCTALEFDKVYKKWSLEFYIQQKYELRQEDAEIFQKKCKELNLSFSSVMSSYYNIKHTKRGLEVAKVYCYKHRSEQEYAAALVICDAIVNHYNDNKNCIDNFQKEGKNVICLAMISAGYMKENQNCLDQEETEKEFPDFASKGGALSELLPFVTGILYYTNERDLLYLVIDDILDLQLKLVDEEWQFDTIEDLVIAHSIETRNDLHIVKAVASKLNSVFSGNIEKMEIKKHQNLASIPLLLPICKPRILHIDYDHNQVSPNLISAIETANQYDVGTNLGLRGVSGAVDDTIAKANTCVGFIGYLTPAGVKALPKCIKELELKMNLEAINELSTRFHELKEVTKLCKLKKNLMS